MQAKRIPLARVQRVVVLQLLQDDPEAWLTVAGLYEALGLPSVADAVAGLAADGVIEAEGARVRASQCVRCLDALGLIAV